MIYKSVEILINGSVPPAYCSVNGQTLLADIAGEYLTSPHTCLLVEDDHGDMIGIVSLSDIQRRLHGSNGIDRRRWMETPAEAILEGRLSTVPRSFKKQAGSHSEDSQSSPLLAISAGGDVMAMVTENDVLVSWRAIESQILRAQNDHVTGLPLRSVFETHLRAECARAERNGHSVGLILVDIDYFKDVNDQFGHAAGDAVLRAVGKTLRSTFRGYDLVARFGGDEFAVLCCGCRPGEIDFTIERLRCGMQKLQSDLSIPRPVPTLSIGACVMHDPGAITSPGQIIETADECLYFAKRDGRNRSFSSELGVEGVVAC